MSTNGREMLERLARHEGWPAISIYLPVHRTGAETRQDPIRLRNLLTRAADALTEGGMRSPEVERILADAWDAQGDPAFWREGFEGLALFITRDTSDVFRSVRTLPERVRVGSRFLLRPLIPATDSGPRFYVLALSQKHVRLFEGTAGEIREMDSAGLPQGLAEALQYDDYERQVQSHSRSTASMTKHGRRSAIFHGHGGGQERLKDDLFRYFRIIDAGLRDLLAPHVPLLLAGVDYLLPIYREANTHDNLFDDAILGNPDEATPHEILDEALELLGPSLTADAKHALQAFAESRASALATSDLHEIVPAAVDGRIETLIVSDEDTGWGVYDTTSGQTTVHTQPQKGDIDLLDYSAKATLLHGGTVYVLGSEEVREAADSDAAALLRY
ncbi:MAG: hypothetical protein RBS78_04140 [Coriobacteriia bacterium]|jgi:hypothetical protein|nr:hypothetical protein [Coriobacteriia bacterium]